MSADLSPQGFLTDTNLFVLEQAATTNLFENILTGVLLPTTEEGYRTRLSIPSEVEDLPQAIRLLLSVYNPVNADCVSFRDETMVNIISMAEDIYSYAQKVAGDGASYFVIFQGLRDMADYDSPYNALHLSTFTLEIDALIQDIARYRSKAQVIAKEVHRFNRQLASDADNLKNTQENVRGELDREVAGNVDAGVQAEIDELRAQAKELQAQAQDQRAGGWMRTLMCTMTGPSLSTIEDRQKNIAARISELNATIQSATEHGANDSFHPYATRMAADTALVEASEGLNDLVATCGPAADIVDGMVTEWGNILDDLVHLKSTVTEDPNASASAMLEMMDQDEVEQKWSMLAERINNFLTVARAMDQKQQTV
ncbi:uncharacterized protein SCHCODRAFT_01357408 [Schizophyllum commune H4-8]|nr:uncharacterized protein SCHCODRAFT_01357408 [Schizophyllum commune H4-8]KAI5889113.1 hypothetical protein SCHCODRAFT_01357408 [Schizophyllum commune H4-8]